MPHTCTLIVTATQTLHGQLQTVAQYLGKHIFLYLITPYVYLRSLVHLETFVTYLSFAWLFLYWLVLILFEAVYSTLS